MRRLIQLLALILAVLSMPAAAQTYYPFYYYGSVSAAPAATRYVSPQARVEREATAAYGPFRVLDENTAALVGVTDSTSTGWFQAMLRDHPGISMLRFVECPGTYDDRANLALGRMIRAAGLAAYVPEDGSVRSGAVELVLAGTSLTIEDGAEFAVHAWLDEDGYEATDYSADSPMNRRYLAYYREMGMDEAEAASFYAMTNSVPFERARWLGGSEMRSWIHRAHPAGVAPAPAFRYEAPAPEMLAVSAFRAAPPALPVDPGRSLADEARELPAAPRLAYLDLGLTLF